MRCWSLICLLKHSKRILICQIGLLWSLHTFKKQIKYTQLNIDASQSFGRSHSLISETRFHRLFHAQISMAVTGYWKESLKDKRQLPQQNWKEQLQKIRNQKE